MILSETAIKLAIQKGMLKIAPFSESQISKAHINLHLGLMGTLDGKLVLAAKAFALAETKETITLSEGLCGFIEGRASLAKLGISIEQSSTFIEPGSDNAMVLEMFNASDSPVTLEAGQPIAKMYLSKIVDTI